MRAWTQFIGVCALLLTACAPLKDPWGLAVSRGLTGDALQQPPAPPDSLQADLGITPREPGLVPFTARLYAKPRRAYRMDAFGFPSLLAASYLWKEGRWMWVRHDSRQVWEGSGNQLELEGSPLQLPDVHAVLGFLWGRPLPGFIERDSLLAPGPAGEIRWSYHGEVWQARIDKASGLCREVHSASLSMKYAKYGRYGGRKGERHGKRVLPGEVEILVNGASVMVLSVRELKDDPFWKKNPFALLPPAGYEHP